MTYSLYDPLWDILNAIIPPLFSELERDKINESLFLPRLFD
jgi:hypothetical protein